MCNNNPATRSNPFDIIFQIEDHEPLLNRTVQLSYHTTIEPSADDSVTMDAWKAAFEKLEFHVKSPAPCTNRGLLNRAVP